MAAELPESDPCHHTRNIATMLDAVINHVRGDIGKISDPKAQALLGTTAEVLTGLKTALEHYEGPGGRPPDAAEEAAYARSTPAAPEVAGFEE